MYSIGTRERERQNVVVIIPRSLDRLMNHEGQVVSLLGTLVALHYKEKGFVLWRKFNQIFSMHVSISLFYLRDPVVVFVCSYTMFTVTHSLTLLFS